MVFLDERQKPADYCHILEQNLLPWEGENIKENFLFQQDDAPVLFSA